MGRSGPPSRRLRFRPARVGGSGGPGRVHGSLRLELEYDEESHASRGDGMTLQRRLGDSS